METGVAVERAGPAGPSVALVPLPQPLSRSPRMPLCDSRCGPTRGLSCLAALQPRPQAQPRLHPCGRGLPYNAGRPAGARRPTGTERGKDASGQALPWGRAGASMCLEGGGGRPGGRWVAGQSLKPVLFAMGVRREGGAGTQTSRHTGGSARLPKGGWTYGQRRCAGAHTPAGGASRRASARALAPRARRGAKNEAAAFGSGAAARRRAARGGPFGRAPARPPRFRPRVAAHRRASCAAAALSAGSCSAAPTSFMYRMKRPMISGSVG
jgi:hypothetical protein